jgi:hypothetical protein
VSRAEAVRVEEAHASREKGQPPLTRADYRLFRYWTRSLLLLVKWGVTLAGHVNLQALRDVPALSRCTAAVKV